MAIDYVTSHLYACLLHFLLCRTHSNLRLACTFIDSDMSTHSFTIDR